MSVGERKRAGGVQLITPVGIEQEGSGTGNIPLWALFGQAESRT
jgi:hypothetical protein